MSQDVGLFAIESQDDVLGAAMAYYDVCQDAVSRLRESDLIPGLYWRLLNTIRQRGDRGEPTLPNFIADAMGADPEFAEWGGYDRLFDLFDRGYAAAVDQHVEAIQDRARRRHLLKLLGEVGARVADTSHDTAGILREVETGLETIQQNAAGSAHFKTAGRLVSDALGHYFGRSGVIEFPIGLRDVDRKLGGLNPGESTVLAADSGMGKTIGAMQIARANASAGVGVCYFSLEMASHPMGLRLACDVAYDRRRAYFAGEPSCPTMKAAMDGELTPSQQADLQEAASIVAGWPLLLDDRPNLTVADMELAARRQHREWRNAGIKPGPIIVDHIGKVKPAKDRRGDRTNEVGDVANDLDIMAKRLGVPVVVLSQINRDIHKGGEDKRPTLANVKQSAVIVENARQVIFLYRPEYYLRQAMEHESDDKRIELRDKAEAVAHHMYWIIAKASNGPTGQVLTFCEARCSAVRDWGSH